jgi:hypothetical protein
MDAQTLLDEVSAYCRRAGMAETTFGRYAVNDGKFVSRLRLGGRVTLETQERVRLFMTGGVPAKANAASRLPREVAPNGHAAALPSPKVSAGAQPLQEANEKNFRFYDNRQKYLMFVNTCSEKRVIAERVSLELANIHPRPPSVRVFDAGVGDGTVLTRVMRTMHQRFEKMPLYIVGKEISLEDVRLTLEKMPDRFHEHPATVLVLTNLNYAEAPYLVPNSVTAAGRLVWHEVALRGSTAAEYEQQINDLEPLLAQDWRAGPNKTNGNTVYEKPVVLVLYLEDCRFLLHNVIPRRGAIRAEYDLIIASQPYRARASAEFKARKVIAPLAQSLAPGGRLIGIHSSGNDPGLEIIQKVWPGEEPFATNRHDILKAVKSAMGPNARHFNLNAYADERSMFRYAMYTLPNEIDLEGPSIGTSTLFAAWNDAAYVAQIDDERLAEAMAGTRYLDATKEVLRKHNGLWFQDESYVISRKRDI